MDLKAILKHEVQEYAKTGYNSYNFFVSSPDECVFAVVSVIFMPDKRSADAALIARIVHDRIVIELDMYDKPLVDALVQAGVPREKIVLAYAGEPVDESLPEIGKYING